MPALNIGLLGFGRTGSIVAGEIVKDKALNLSWIARKSKRQDLLYGSHALGFDSNFAPFVTPDQLTHEFLRQNPTDLVIDFSSPQALSLYPVLASNDVKIVSAISKYSESDLEYLKSLKETAAILHSPNITLGINWVMIASKLLKSIVPHADIEIVEEHFRSKHEVSGTALRLAQHLELDSAKHVNSIRVGGIVGKHEVIFGLPNQTIRLTHESINRAAFGTGAIFAAKWLAQKTKGLYNMEQAIHETFLSKIGDLRI